MPKKKEQRFTKDNRPIRKSEYDPERECFMDDEGNYTYYQWKQQPNGQWLLVSVCTARIGEDGVTSDLTIVLDDMDCDVDRQNNRERKHRDHVFDQQVEDYEEDPDGEDDLKAGPWDRAAYLAQQGKDILDEIYPEKPPQDPRMARLLELMDSLTEDQRNLIYAHLGEGKYFEQIAAEESARKGRPITRQAISNRWDKILARLCKGFGVEKPRRRNDRKDEE